MRRKCMHGICVFIKRVNSGYRFTSPCKCFKF